MSKKAFVKKPMFDVKHVGGRKFVQPGTEYVHKEKARRYRTGRNSDNSAFSEASHHDRFDGSGNDAGARKWQIDKTA